MRYSSSPLNPTLAISQDIANVMGQDQRTCGIELLQDPTFNLMPDVEPGEAPAATFLKSTKLTWGQLEGQILVDF